VQRRLSACDMYLNYGSKLRMLNSVLSSLLMFYLCSLKVYQWVLTEVDKYIRHCLWRDKDLPKKNPPLAAYDLVCRPKDQGGLGLLNLSVQNDYLLIKHLHKFYNKADLPWVKMSWELYYSTSLPPARSREVSFWWRDYIKLLPTFKERWPSVILFKETPLYYGKINGQLCHSRTLGHISTHSARMKEFVSSKHYLCQRPLIYFICPCLRKHCCSFNFFKL
jgi:hypothetical protein